MTQGPWNVWGCCEVRLLAGFEDGRGIQSKEVGRLWRLEKARKWILIFSSHQEEF